MLKTPPEPDQWFQSYEDSQNNRKQNKYISFSCCTRNQCCRLQTDPARSQHIKSVCVEKSVLRIRGSLTIPLLICCIKTFSLQITEGLTRGNRLVLSCQVFEFLPGSIIVIYGLTLDVSQSPVTDNEILNDVATFLTEDDSVLEADPTSFQLSGM